MLGKVANTPGTIYLPSGATANIRLELPPGASAQVVTDVDMYAYLLDAIALSVEVYVATYTTLLGASTEEQRVVADALGSAVDFPRCAENALPLSPAGDLTRDALSRWGKVASDCVGIAANGLGKSALTNVAQAVARFASIAAFVVRVIRTVIASGEILGDIFTNTVAYLPAYTLLLLKSKVPGGSGVVTPDGAVGNLQFGKSTESDVRASAGAPGVVAQGSFHAPGHPDYKALGYDCAASALAGCLTIYYLDATTGLLEAFYTASPHFETTKGTKVGMTSATAQQREGGSVGNGCVYGITLFDKTPATILMDRHSPARAAPAPTDLVTDLKSEATSSLGFVGGVGLLFC
jgi:hypothetical protein